MKFSPTYNNFRYDHEPNAGHLKRSEKKSTWSNHRSLTLGGGFKYCLFSPLPGEDFQSDEYFSNGLVQPPTRTVSPLKMGHANGGPPKRQSGNPNWSKFQVPSIQFSGVSFTDKPKPKHPPPVTNLGDGAEKKYTNSSLTWRISIHFFFV